MKRILFFILIQVSLISCFATESPTSTAEPISHDIWDKLLKKHVNAKGDVSYAGFVKDKAELRKYLTLIEVSAPNNSWSKDEQLAYWINAYNAFTVQLILDHLNNKITSIKDIGAKVKIPFVNTPWDVKFINIGGKKLDLNNIEHGIIRDKFSEPRIHFALVCAAKSCPPLRNEAYIASKLDKQLDEQGVNFINDSFKNQIDKNQAKISKLFLWYGGDFKKKMPIIDWINKYAKVKTDAKSSISYMEYIWILNGTY